MALKKIFTIIVVVLVVSLLGACVRSASTPPPEVITPPSQVEDKGQPTPTNEVLDQLALFVTQTAAAANLAAGQPPAGEATPVAPPAEAGATAEPGTSAGEPTQPVAGAEPTLPVPVVQPTEPTLEVPQAQPTDLPPLQPTDQVVQPTVPNQIIVPTATPGRPATYQIQTGEFPFCIARRFDLDISQLLSLNGLGTGSIVRSGTVLKIPQSGQFPGKRALNPHPTVYTVKAGQNIYDIACYFGDVSPDAIAYANNLQPPFNLTTGQQLTIP